MHGYCAHQTFSPPTTNQGRPSSAEKKTNLVSATRDEVNVKEGVAVSRSVKGTSLRQLRRSVQVVCKERDPQAERGRPDARLKSSLSAVAKHAHVQWPAEFQREGFSLAINLAACSFGVGGDGRGPVRLTSRPPAIFHPSPESFVCRPSGLAQLVRDIVRVLAKAQNTK